MRREEIWHYCICLCLLVSIIAGDYARESVDAGEQVIRAGFISVPFLRNEISAEERRKREMFLKARERTLNIPTPTPSPTPVPRPARRPEPMVTPTPRPTPKSTPVPQRKSEPAPRQTPTPGPTPVPVFKGRLVSTPAPSPTATPAPREDDDSRVVVHKSGRLEEKGYEPPPKKDDRGFFERIFGGGPKYKYLTSGVREEIDRPKVKRERWKYIIIHNSGTRSGNAAIFGHYHRNVRKMQNGMAYHFVIGNGSKSGDGQIEIGDRWRQQINGGHVASDYLNNIAIGICLVGDFNRDEPSTEQIEALEELVDYLQKRVGKIDGKHSIVKAHKAINPRPTDCPGNKFPYRWLSRKYD